MSTAREVVAGLMLESGVSILEERTLFWEFLRQSGAERAYAEFARLRLAEGFGRGTPCSPEPGFRHQPHDYREDGYDSYANHRDWRDPRNPYHRS